MNTPDDISRISKIHSRQLIIFYFSRFLPKKIELQSQQKNYLHDKYRLFAIAYSAETIVCLSHQMAEIFNKIRYRQKKLWKKCKKNFDLDFLKNLFF